MLWVWIFLGLGVAGVVALVIYGVGLAHKAGDLQHEAGLTLKRVEEARALAERIRLPASGRD
ncbi:MAG: hypothetical protein QM713_03050 [Arachnia sp.]